MYYLAGKCETAFKKAGQRRGFVMDDLRMDEFSTMAMVHEANLTTAALQTINRYLTSFFGRRLMASERR